MIIVMIPVIMTSLPCERTTIVLVIVAYDAPFTELSLKAIRTLTLFDPVGRFP